MLRKKVLILVIALLVAPVILGGLLSGCSKYSNRHVRGAVLAMPASEDVGVPDLLITNWASGKSPGEFLVTYTTRAGKTRRVLWEKTLEEFDTWYYPQAAFDESYIYYVAGARLLVLSRADGAVAWEAPLSDLMRHDCPNCIQKVKDHVVALTVDYVLQGVNARDGKPAWSVRLNDSATAYEGFRVVNDQVVLLDQGGPDVHGATFHVFDSADGKLLRQIAPTCPHADADSWLDIEEAFVEQNPTRGARAIFLYDCWADHYSYVQSWNLTSGEVVWQVPLPEEADTSVDSFLLGQDTLYLDTYNGLFGISLNSGQTESLVREIDPDYDVTLLAERGERIIAWARRTRGSSKYELWGLYPTGERIWRHEMQVDDLYGMDSGTAEGAYHLTPNGMVVIQILDEPEQVLVEMLDPQTGQVTHQSTAEIEYASLYAAVWSSHYAYLTVYGDLYAVDLETGEVALDWP
ncbi:MAG: PQQ-binding-like beta-propeller repeat protein [Anaerolineae bacterium]